MTDQTNQLEPELVQTKKKTTIIQMGNTASSNRRISYSWKSTPIERKVRRTTLYCLTLGSLTSLLVSYLQSIIFISSDSMFFSQVTNSNIQSIWEVFVNIVPSPNYSPRATMKLYLNAVPLIHHNYQDVHYFFSQNMPKPSKCSLSHFLNSIATGFPNFTR